ncbi:hypothetical protein LTR36_008845 [Oleoguttula mirabilis]|uniref:F-box domain-containing protein n=1 Tax=Oleoguttula mirabilis TaxID=1507867 RepID=A0AAV9J934_9PEZI|nr:hypothetical protein LTR36_008845 [Oleoguttula mirabilis]
MPSFLDLPRELYLEVCSYLKHTDLTRLAGVSRDSYLAVQEPLYARIRITAYGNLVKLVHTLRGVPVVSQISPQQRLRWRKLSDTQLRERDIKHLELVIDRRGNDSKRITGAIVANCIGAISRQCYKVQITLTMNSAWLHFMKQLENFGLPNVTKLIMFAGAADTDPAAGHHAWTSNFWDLIFSGSTFPDLRSAYVNTAADSETGLPATLQESVGFVAPHNGPRYIYQDAKNKPRTSNPLHGLHNMQEIILAHNTYLDLPVIESLFGSEIIPKRLTRLEIVDCPNLHPVNDLTALSTLLQRALQLVQHLKLHLCKLPRFDSGETYLDTRYAARIHEHPEEHLCNIIRELGQNVRSLDIAVPFACNDIFSPSVKKAKAYATPHEYPPVSLEPYVTLPSRILAEGYRYRRLVCWHAVCRDAHAWQDMIDTASEQGSNISWDMVYPPEDRASWHVSGCLPLLYTADEVLQKPFDEAA